MANTREIKLRIKGVNETKKITKAMKLIAAVKLKKAREMHEITLPFFKHIQETMIDILERVPNIELEYFNKREDKPNRKKAYIVITSDSGLTGGYNTNAIKYAVNLITDKENSVVFPIGNAVRNYMVRNKYNVRDDIGFSPEEYDISIRTARKVSRNMIKLFKAGEIDEVELVYTEMLTALSQKPRSIKLLPLERKNFERIDTEEDKKRIHQELEIEPSPEVVFDVLTRKYVKGIIYGGMVESFASENSARMNAMDSATSNAEKMVSKLTLNYNRARQAAITQEISEIISGATNV